MWSARDLKGKNCSTSVIRVFSEIEAMRCGTKVKDYITLDAHLGLILYEGWVDKEQNETQLEAKRV